MKRGPRCGSRFEGTVPPSNDELMVWCEKEGIDYVLGLAQNDRLKRRIADPDGDRPAVAAGDGRGREAVPGTALSDAQESPRASARVVAKVSRTEPRGKNPRFIVTSVPVQECDGAKICTRQVYCARGDIPRESDKGTADRVCLRTARRPGSMAGNQLRLYFSAFAYVMMETLRQGGAGGDEAGRGRRAGPCG